jgi:signal transduction histidine kinase
VPGTGLGLCVVQSVALAHKGEVRLLPAEPGRGAAFRVVLPLP